MSLIVLGDVPAPAQRCHRCGRVRDVLGDDWLDDEARRPSEVSVTCALCAELLRRLAEQRRVREGRRLLRQRAKGYGPGKGDAFAGFREDS